MQRFVLDELNRRADPAHPSAWTSAEDIAWALSAVRNIRISPALLESVRRAIRTLAAAGEIETPLYGRRSRARLPEPQEVAAAREAEIALLTGRR